MRAGLSLKPHKLHMVQVTCCCPLSRKGGGGREGDGGGSGEEGTKGFLPGLGDRGHPAPQWCVSLNQSNDTSYQVPIGEPQQTNKQTSLNKNKATNRIKSTTEELWNKLQQCCFKHSNFQRKIVFIWVFNYIIFKLYFWRKYHGFNYHYLCFYTCIITIIIIIMGSSSSDSNSSISDSHSSS